MGEDTTLNFDGIDGGIVLTRSDFVRMMMPTESGTVDLRNFGCWLRVEPDGLYVNIDHEDEVGLTPEEAAALCAHPTGNLGVPALRFPFTVGELKGFLAFAREEGCDVPLSGAKFAQVLAAKGPRQRIEVPPRKLLPAQRHEQIQAWLNEQSEYTAGNLRSAERGLPGARDACWRWLKKHDLTGHGKLFGGAFQRGQEKTKTFDRAWSAFLKEGE